jgi:hypothetical protein
VIEYSFPLAYAHCFLGTGFEFRFVLSKKQ